LTDKEDVAKMFDKYNFIAMPVVDMENRLVGIITIDDAIDVLQEEAEEDFEKMAAVTPSDESYFKTTVFKHAKNRIVWLIFLMLASILTGNVISMYENAFSALPILVAFVPLLMGTGGNCGAQTSTLVIRGFSQDEIKLKDFLKVWWKEVRVAILVGTTLALINAIRIFIQYDIGQTKLAVVVGLTLIIVAMLAKSLGCILPMLAKKLKLDPAIMASPLITTIVDTCSVLVYFNLAVLILGV
ncbi:MAG: magnesium transporter, partial [Dorea sp.]|nr:magnesium transporter [Dorea sp.]